MTARPAGRRLNGELAAILLGLAIFWLGLGLAIWWPR